MIPARQELIKTVAFVANGVETVDLKIDGLIDRLLFCFRGTAVGATGTYREASNGIASVELICDGKTLKKIDGKYMAQTPALAVGQYPQDQVASAATFALDGMMIMHIKDPFCRNQLDTGLHTRYYNNVQVRITWADGTTCYSSSGSGVVAGCVLDVIAVYRKVPPIVTQAFQELTFTAPALASGSNDVKISANGGRLRRLWLFAGTPGNIGAMSLIIDNNDYPIKGMTFAQIQRYKNWVKGSGGGTSEALSFRMNTYVSYGITGPWCEIDLAGDMNTNDLPDLARVNDVTLQITATGASTLQLYTGIYIPYRDLGGGAILPPLAEKAVQAARSISGSSGRITRG